VPLDVFDLGDVAAVGTSRPGKWDRYLFADSPRPAGHHHDPVAEAHGFADVVRDEDNQTPLLIPQSQQFALKHPARLLIERREGFVHEQQSRSGHERATDPHALLHAHGELVRVAIEE